MVTSTALYTNAATVQSQAASSAPKVNLPSGIKSYEAEAAKPKTSAAGNQQDFLKLFTTQLQNQNPLDPVKNEAFVAQLAQFSQLEASNNMATQLTSIAGSLNANQMMTGAGLIGKSVILAGSNFNLKQGEVVQGLIDLPNGADGLKVDVLNSANEVVSTDTLGQQNPGPFYFSWNGNDKSGNPLPEGSYRFRVAGSSGGTSITPAVSQRKAILGVSRDSASGDILLDIQGGKTMRLADSARIGS